jgi:hypothetical protein
MKFKDAHASFFLFSACLRAAQYSLFLFFFNKTEKEGQYPCFS